MPSLLFYISGHGYGHARRMTQVIRELIRSRPDVQIHIRSAAPPRVFEPLPRGWVSTCEIDSGLAETDPFTIDRAASLQRLSAFMARRGKIAADEAAIVRQFKPDLIVADIPFLAGDVAAAAGVRCVGISNFTWDWIYENLLGDDARYTPMGRAIADSYAKMFCLLELPFGQTCREIPTKIAVPLIALQSRREPGAILAQIGIAPDDGRPRVLIGTRGALAPEILANAAGDAKEFLFLCPHESTETVPANGVSIPLGRDLDFSDVLRISDVVVSKLGYGMISECICGQTRLVWPPRDGFIEDQIVAAEAPKFVPMLPMPMADYRGGNWGTFLRQAMKLPASSQIIATNGACLCAGTILEMIG
ncbi:MAG TPA: hypothetical protein VFE47_21050 [Tepidisphaeraceae bacterium]|jgi:L-arabinokinase|nr:hypothetical protein [Tepidisphaeraceae bacterium]